MPASSSSSAVASPSRDIDSDHDHQHRYFSGKFPTHTCLLLSESYNSFPYLLDSPFDRPPAVVSDFYVDDPFWQTHSFGPPCPHISL